jgi:hypothetical protein
MTTLSLHTQQEARRILNNMSSMAGYHGTTTADVVDYMVENWSMTVFCNGQLRNIIFTPITGRNFSFKTEAV